MKANGTWGNDTEEENRCGQMGLFMRDIFKMIWPVVIYFQL